VAARQILSANHNLIQESSFLEVYFLIKKKKMPFSLMKVAGKLLGNGSEIVAEWVDTLTEIAYEGKIPSSVTFLRLLSGGCSIGVKHRKKLKVLVNPHSGPVTCLAIPSRTLLILYVCNRVKRARSSKRRWNPSSVRQIVPSMSHVSQMLKKPKQSHSHIVDNALCQTLFGMVTLMRSRKACPWTGMLSLRFRGMVSYMK